MAQDAGRQARAGRRSDHEGDDVLLGDLFDLLQQVETDMTLFFRGLMADRCRLR